MFAYIHHLLSGQNQFASGGLLLMLVGSVGVFLRSLPQLVWEFVLRQTTLTITVKDDDAAFQWVKQWLLEQDFLRRVRRVDLDTTLRGEEMALIPSPGLHFFVHRKRPFSVRFARSEDTKGRSQRRIESLTFQTLGRQQTFLKAFVAEIVACHHRTDRTATALHTYEDYWTCVQAYSPRLLDSVVLQADEKERLVQDVQRFRDARARYQRLGVPYHRGYLLYGPPGTGKTSLVSGIAAHFGMPIYAINLTEMSDRSLKSAVNEIPENSVVLFEDIDCMRAGHRRGEEAKSHVGPNAAGATATDGTLNHFGVTLSGLLNVLDGFYAPVNVIFIMTTNDVEALDPALLRPGRIDYKLFLGKAAPAQKLELYRRFFPAAALHEGKQFVQMHEAETMAEFQGLLLRFEQRQKSAFWDAAPGSSRPSQTKFASVDEQMQEAALLIRS